MIARAWGKDSLIMWSDQVTNLQRCAGEAHNRGSASFTIVIGHAHSRDDYANAYIWRLGQEFHFIPFFLREGRLNIMHCDQLGLIAYRHSAVAMGSHNNLRICSLRAQTRLHCNEVRIVEDKFPNEEGVYHISDDGKLT